MDDVLTRLRAAAAAVLADEPVCVAYLFGSHARGEASQLSDVALLAPDVLPHDRLDLRLRVIGCLSTTACIPDSDLDVVVLDESPLTLTGRVIRDGIVIYSADESARFDYESRVFREFVDFSLFADEIDLEMLRQIADGKR